MHAWPKLPVAINYTLAQKMQVIEKSKAHLHLVLSKSSGSLPSLYREMKNSLSDFFRFVSTFNLIGWDRMHFSSFFKQNRACFIFSPRAFSTIRLGGVTSMPSVTSWKVIPGSPCLQTITTYNFNTFHAGNENSNKITCCAVLGLQIPLNILLSWNVTVIAFFFPMRPCVICFFVFQRLLQYCVHLLHRWLLSVRAYQMWWLFLYVTKFQIVW